MKGTTKRRGKSEAELLNHATNNLLWAVKRKIIKKEGRVNYEKLRKEGYSERLLTRLRKARN